MVYYMRTALDVELTRKGVHMNSLAMIDLKQFMTRMEDLEKKLKEQSIVVNDSDSTKFSLVQTALKNRVLSQLFKEKVEGVELEFKFVVNKVAFKVIVFRVSNEILPWQILVHNEGNESDRDFVSLSNQMNLRGQQLKEYLEQNIRIYLRPNLKIEHVEILNNIVAKIKPKTDYNIGLLILIQAKIRRWLSRARYIIRMRGILCVFWLKNGANVARITVKKVMVRHTKITTH